MKPEKNKEAQASDERLRKVRTVTYSSKIDPLRQGQRLNAIDQKPKQTAVTLDAVMQEAEGKREKPGAKNKAETPQAKLFPLTSATLPK